MLIQRPGQIIPLRVFVNQQADSRRGNVVIMTQYANRYRMHCNCHIAAPR
jgi:hypothetical protein